MKFNITHASFERNHHGLNGYKELIETIIWGLEASGHQVGYAANRIEGDARNIILCAQLIPLEFLRQLPPDTILYNCEQVRGLDLTVNANLKFCADNFEIWDYSEANFAAWSALTPRFPIKYVPVGYAPILERIVKPADQDIDVLMYGLPGVQRLSAFKSICQGGMTAVFLCGMYGAARDELISRSKVIVNVTLYDRSRIFEIVRTSYLFANRKAVVAHVGEDIAVEKDILGAFRLTTAQTLVSTVKKLVSDEFARVELEERAYGVMRRRDMGEILAAALH